MSKQQPNLLYIFTDEQRLDTLACYGNSKIQMPNLNSLADRSVVFSEPYCCQPVCTPSRGSLMSGLYPHTHGAVTNNVPIPEDVPCMPELLSPERRKQYTAGYMGKWHLGDEIFRQHGFDEWVATEEYTAYFSEKRDRNANSDYFHYLHDVGFRSVADSGKGFGRDFACSLPEVYSKPYFAASEASRFIRNNNGRPWMLAVNFLEPHAPFHSCRDGQYAPEDVDLPHNFDDTPNEGQPAFLSKQRQKLEEKGSGGNPLQTEEDWRRLIARYWGLNSLVDTQVGRMLKTLEDTGQMDNTIIVFTSDHGEMMASHKLLFKCVMFKESTQVPMIVHLPGQTKQARINGPVSQIDLLPTLLDLMGEDVSSKGLQGTSLADLCRNAANQGGEHSAVGKASACVVEWNPGHQLCKDHVRTLITPEGERFSHYSGGFHEFYDLNNDPKEVHNLAQNPDKQERMRELCKQINEWQEKTADVIERVAL